MGKFKVSSKKAGLAPGSVVATSKSDGHPASMNFYVYNKNDLVEKTIKNAKDIPEFNKENVNWLCVQGVHDTVFLEELGKKLGLHPLLLEDVANVNQRPKFENYGPHDFVVMRYLHFDEKDSEIKSEQVTFVLADEYVLSFEENHSDLFRVIVERIKNGKGKIRKQTPDYLLYTLMDLTVDNYFKVLERIGEKIEELDDQLATEPTQETMRNLHKLKRELIFFRKSVWPLREVIRSLQAEGHPIVEDENQIYLRDLHDHLMQVIDITETYRDILGEMLDVYLSTISNKLNEVMKVLTIISTIFIPVTFVASIYGMNFEYMPELHDPNGYWYIMTLMAIIIGVMVIYFKKRKWL